MPGMRKGARGIAAPTRVRQRAGSSHREHFGVFYRSSTPLSSTANQEREMPCARSPTLEALAKPKVSPPPRCSNASAMRARVVECLSPIRGQRHRWWRRASTDLRVLQHANREYGKMLRRLPHAEAVRTVLDAGANAGFSSSLFASLLPRVATVLAVEPNAQNHAMLALNTAGHSTVLPLRAAVWGRDEPMRVDDGARKSRVANNIQWSYVTLPRPARHEPSSSDVDGVSVPTILRWVCLDQFDFAKLDIESGPASACLLQGHCQQKTSALKCGNFNSLLVNSRSPVMQKIMI